MKDLGNLCMKCMNDKGHSKQCPFCGDINNDEQSSKFMGKRVVLQDKYVVGNKISENSESVCYIGYDIKNRSRIHIREFFPSDICTRSSDGHTVKIKESCNERYDELQEDFLKYFRALAKVRNIDAAVSVYDIFVECGTAYIISEIIDGISLYSLIKKNEKPLDWETAKVLFMPTLSAFSKLSNAGIRHLAINPETLVIGRDGKMHISGFSTRNVRQQGVFSFCEFYSGFTAPEQYIKDHNLTQSTDVYSFTASLFFALVGFAPKDASKRDMDDRLLIPVKILKNIPPHVVSAIANGLNVNEQKRTQTFEMLRDELTETSAKYLKEQDDILYNNNYLTKKQNKKNNVKWVACSTFIVALLLFGAFFVFFTRNSKYNEYESQDALVLQEQKTSEDIIVPDFVGKSFEEIKKIESDNDNYKVFLSEKTFDDNIEEGKIISQIPQAGLSVKKGSNIVVTVSKGTRFRVLPQISGLSLAHASTLLAKEGFIPIKIDEYSNEATGTVIKYKDHNQGDKLEYGSEIKIVVSKGPMEMKKKQ